MEPSIGNFCNSLATFCNHLETSCAALKQSVERRPIPLDSASTTFVHCLNRKVSSASSDLNLLESMSFSTVSFEELLGHCNEVFKKNQNDLLLLHHRLSASGYVTPDIDGDEDVEEDASGHLLADSSLDLKNKGIEDDSLFDDSLSLQKFGLSDVCLASIASEANSKMVVAGEYEPATKAIEMEEEDELEGTMGTKLFIVVSRDDYEHLPNHMKSLASWEDLLGAVEKMNVWLQTKRSKPDIFFHQDDIALLGLGHKARSYLLLLIKMNRLIVETIHGLISYRVL